MSEEFIPTLTHATERDIDLLLVEELHASLDFTLWMARMAGVESSIATWDVKHSKRRTRSRREIDIFLEITDLDGRRSALLIENKLDAGEQPDQAESYREELGALSAGYSQAAMALVCPEAYAAQHADFSGKFDVVVTYESVGRFFRELETEAGSDTVLRYRFRAEVLDQAVNKHRRGYTPIPDKTVGDFNARYVSLMRRLAPEIIPGPSMLKPANPRESTSMIFDQAGSLRGLPPDIRPRRFAHELGRGSDRRANYVAVTFAGWGAALPSIQDTLTADAASIGASFASATPTKTRPNPGLVMSVPSSPVDNQHDFDAQAHMLEEGINTARMLRGWLLENSETLRRWKRLVDGHGSGK